MYKSFTQKNHSLSGVSRNMVTNTQVSYIAKSSHSTSVLTFSLQIYPFSTDCYINFDVFQCSKMFHILINVLFYSYQGELFAAVMAAWLVAFVAQIMAENSTTGDQSPSHTTQTKGHSTQNV